MQTVRGNTIELTTIHPAWGDLEVEDVHALAGHGLRMSPHVGNLDKITDDTPEESLPHFVGAHLLPKPAVSTRTNVALALMGLRVECADTTALNDESTRPYVILQDDKETPLTNMSRMERETHVPAAVTAHDANRTIQDIHMEALRSIAPNAVTRTDFYDRLGVEQGYSRGELYRALTTAFDGVARVAREGRVSSDEGQRVHTSEVDRHGVFGSGEDPLSGIMPPVEVAIAAELVEAAIEGRDELHHIGGMDMQTYTQKHDFMHRAVIIAERALAAAGAQVPNRLIYTVINKYHGVAGLAELARQIGTAIGLERYTQHDLHGNPHALKKAREVVS